MAKRIFTKLIAYFVTFLLIVTSFLCIFLVAKGAINGNVSLFGYRFFYVVTGSMEPTIPVGSVILSKSLDDYSYSVGDIITFKSRLTEIYGQPNTHRIVKILDNNGLKSYVTQGDANDSADPIPVFPTEIYGKVIWHSSNSNILPRIISFLTTPYGFLFTVLLPILLITISLLKEFTKTYKKALETAFSGSVNYDVTDDKAKGESDESKPKQQK